jgi:SAM-dependent methyltransferase
MPGVTVRYIERFTPAENAALFTERSDQEFQLPDIVTNLDRERLRCLRDASQDFVLASHVLEHLAEPLGMLDDLHRVLRPGGALLIVLPDRRRTADDAARTPTSVAHLAAEYRAGVTEVSDEHIQEYLEALTLPSDDPGRLTSAHELRLRSIHVHLWSDDEFLEVLDHCVANLGHTWEFVDGCATDDPALEGWEFAYLVRRGRTPTNVSRYRAGLQEWRKRRDTVLGIRARADGAEARVAAAEVRGAAAEVALANLRRSRSWKITRPLRAVKSSISRLPPGRQVS